MSEKQKNNQHDNVTDHEPIVDPTTSQEAATNDRKENEKEKRSRDLENLEKVANAKAEVVAQALIKKEGEKFYPSEVQAYKNEIANELKAIFKRAYESGGTDSVVSEMDSYIEKALSQREQDKVQRKLVAESPVIKSKVGELEDKVIAFNSELSEVEHTDEEFENYRLAKSELTERRKQLESVDKYCEDRWNNLSEEDRQDISDKAIDSINVIKNNTSLSSEEKRLKVAELQMSIAQEWGPDRSANLISAARTKSSFEGQPSTNELNAAKDGQKNNPVRANALKRFFKKMNYARVMSNGNPAVFLAEAFSKKGTSKEALDSRSRKIALTMGGVALAGATAYAAYRGISAIDWDARVDLGGLGSIGDGADSAPVSDPNADWSHTNLDTSGRSHSPTGEDWSHTNLDTSGRSHSPTGEDWSHGNLDASGSNLDADDSIGGDYDSDIDTQMDQLNDNSETPWSDHNYFDHGYDIEDSPFSSDLKTGEYNYGPSIEIDEHFNDGLLDYADSEKGIHASYIKGFNIEGSELSIDQIEERLLTDRDYFESTLEEIRNRMESGTQTVRRLESGTYGSTYGYEMNGEMVVAYDGSIDEIADVVEYRYLDENGNEQITIIKANCGGQIVVEHNPGTSTLVQYPGPAVQEVPVTPETPTVTPPKVPVTPETPTVTPPDVPVTPETTTVTPPDVPGTPETPTVTPETPDVPETPKLEGKTEVYLDPKELELAEINGPNTPQEQTVTDPDIMNGSAQSASSPETVAGTNTQDRVEFTGSGANQEEVKKLDLTTTPESGISQSVRGEKGPIPNNPGQETDIYANS